MRGHRKVWVAAATALTFMATASSAQAQRPVSLGEGAPVGQSGIQLYNFSSYLSNGAGEIMCPASPAPPTPYCVGPTAPTTTMARHGAPVRVPAVARDQQRRALRLSGQPVPERRPAERQPAGPAGAARARRQVRHPLPRPPRHRSTRRNWDNRDRGLADPRPGSHRRVRRRATPVASTPTQAPCRPRSSSTSSASARSRRASARRTSTTTTTSSGATQRFMDNGVLKSGGRSSWSAPTRAGWSRRSTSAGRSAAAPATSSRPTRPGHGVRAAMINKFGPRVISLPLQGRGRGRHPPQLRQRRAARDRPGRDQLRADDRGREEPLEVLLHGARPGRDRRADELQPVHQHREQHEGDAGPTRRRRCTRRRRLLPSVAAGTPPPPTRSRSSSPTTVTRR